MEEKEFLGQAERRLSNNDLFWDFTWHDDDYKFYHLKWSGYNDNFWWTSVATTMRNKRITQDGVTFEINFENCNVYLVKN